MANRTTRTPEKVSAFLVALTETASVTASCEVAGIARASIYEWRDQDPDFRDQWEAALELGTDALEDEAVRRASEGTDEPVFYQGQQCGKVRKYSDVLLIVMLKARRGHKFREQSSVEHSGNVTVATVNYAETT